MPRPRISARAAGTTTATAAATLCMRIGRSVVGVSPQAEPFAGKEGVGIAQHQSCAVEKDDALVRR